MQECKISIITIVYNDIHHIKETMDSVFHQSYQNIEYIIIDGLSNDGTKEAIESYIKKIATITQIKHLDTSFYLEAKSKQKPHFSFKFLSQKDSGIYDAMNKGIDLATGEWCNFMNCGDSFYDDFVIEKLFKAYKESKGGG